MANLCRTTVLLFGGFQDRERYVFTDTWLFDGIREELRDEIRSESGRAISHNA